MVSLNEIVNIIKMLGDVISSTREIIEAVKDGRKFLKLHYPDAQNDFSDLISQIQHTIEGMAKVTSVINGFRFVTSTNSNDYTFASQEMARFNDYIIAQRKDIDALKNDI